MLVNVTHLTWSSNRCYFGVLVCWRVIWILKMRDHRALRFILSLKDFLSLVLGAGTGPGPWSPVASSLSYGACSRDDWGWLCGCMSRTPSGACLRLAAADPPALFRCSCWMMAENLASREGLPVLDLVAGREAQAPEFSFSWYGRGWWREAGSGGLVGRTGGV